MLKLKSDVIICRVDMEMMTPALKIWRNAVVTSQSASQLAMCLFMLYDCVAWEKSIMKVVSMPWRTCFGNVGFEGMGVRYTLCGR